MDGRVSHARPFVIECFSCYAVGEGLAPPARFQKGFSQRGTKPFRKIAGGSETRPYNVSGRLQQNGTPGWQAPPLQHGRKTSCDEDRARPALKDTALAGCPKKTDGKPGKIGRAPLKKFENTLDTHGGVDV